MLGQKLIRWRRRSGKIQIVGRKTYAAAALVLASCGGGADEATGVVPAANGIVGKVTMEDGGPPRGEIKDIAISVYGVSDAAEKVSYSPAVKPDGTYQQKVAGGQYGFHPARITVLYNGGEFTFPLEPVGPLWNKNRDAAEGIVQDFVWRVTGPTPYGRSEGLDPGNHTHWYGMSINLRADGWRNDINAAPTAIPVGTKLVFTLKPGGKSIDGRDLETMTFERTYSDQTAFDPDINDIPPAPYELTGKATLPDGTTKPLLLQGPGDYPNYKATVAIVVAKDAILGKLGSPPCTFVIE